MSRVSLAGPSHHWVIGPPLHAEEVLKCRLVRAVAHSKEIAVGPMFQFMSPWVFPVIENLAAQDVPPHAPGRSALGALQMRMAEHQIVEVHDFERRVIEPWRGRRLQEEER